MKNKQPKIKYFDVWGLRKEKYKFLESRDIKNTKWQELELKEPHYFFVPKDFRSEGKYSKFVSVKDIFGKYNAGIATGKNDVLVDFDKHSLIRKLSVLDKNLFKIAMRNYRVKEELVDKWYKELKEVDIENQVKLYSYRPFDNRFTIYNSKILQRARQKIMNNFLRKNIGIILQNVLKGEVFTEIFISRYIIDKHLIGHQSYVFPLYLYDEQESQYIFNGQKRLDIDGVQKELDKSQQDKKSNIKREIFDSLKTVYKQIVSPEEIFYYIYAILYSNIYRQKYNEFLRIDFPKIPFAASHKTFTRIVRIGEKLVNLHLLKSPELKKPVAKFPITGDSRVAKREYNKQEKRIYINNKQCFENVELEVWNYYIGGYQVLDKWLKDKIGKSLSNEDINHYLKVITAIKHTINLQKEIDKIYPEVEKNLIK